MLLTAATTPDAVATTPDAAATTSNARTVSRWSLWQHKQPVSLPLPCTSADSQRPCCPIPDAGTPTDLPQRKQWDPNAAQSCTAGALANQPQRVHT